MVSVEKGSKVEGRYELLERLGEGTFGEVWSARDLRFKGRRVAIKFLKGEFINHSEVVDRFESESEALEKVRHPNVVSVTDRGAWEGTRYLVEEFIAGRSLGHWIQAHRTRGRVPELRVAHALFDQVAAGVAAAHRVKSPGPIVHRDLKPANVMLEESDGEVFAKVLDFGLARLGARSGTVTGAMMGTPRYMAPEQAMGQVSAVGPWTDVFALGVIWVEMLTLREQFDGERTWAWFALRRGGELRGLLDGLRADVPPAVWDVTAKALSCEGDDRYPDASRLREALREAVTGERPRASVEDTLLARPEELLPGDTLLPDPRPATLALSSSTPEGSTPSPSKPSTPSTPSMPSTRSHSSAPPSTLAPSTRSSPKTAVEARPESTPAAPKRTLGQGALVAGAVVLASALGAAGGAWLITRSTTTRGDPVATATKRDAGGSAPSVTEDAGAAVAQVAPSCPEGMVGVPGGSFQMGSPEGEGDSDEHPRHEVRLEGYCIDRTEVTVGRYRACVRAGACTQAPSAVSWPPELAPEERVFWSRYCNAERRDREDHPINCVDWPRADLYCRWRGGRLPTEVEWEYAARGTDRRRYPWGDEAPSPTRLNACGTECSDLARRARQPLRAMYEGTDGWAGTAPVGSFPQGASPFGVLDLAGNVWEWTADTYGPYTAPGVPATSWVAEGIAYVIRGGGWETERNSRVRAAYRGVPATVKMAAFGFRCVRR